MIYFVTTFKHTSEGWAYKVENRYSDIDTATKAFYSLCGNNINADGVDNYTCILEDSLGNQIEKKAWVKEQPEPNEE